jgi:hypothetical protein
VSYGTDEAARSGHNAWVLRDIVTTNGKGTHIMKHDQNNSGGRMLSDADLDAIVGGAGVVETVVNVVKAILNPENWTCSAKSCVFETGPQ